MEEEREEEEAEGRGEVGISRAELAAASLARLWAGEEATFLKVGGGM